MDHVSQGLKLVFGNLLNLSNNSSRSIQDIVNFLILFQEIVPSTWNRWFLPKIISPVPTHGLVESVARAM